MGAWPIGLGREGDAPETPPELVDRLRVYMQKAIREAKRHTSWITPNPEYEAGVASFVERTLSVRHAPGFLASFVEFLRDVDTVGLTNSLAQLVLKLTSPGVADFYQGTELWDQSLVDPDNRRPVDFARRRDMLADLEPWLAAAVPDAPAAGRSALRDAVASLFWTWPDGRIKMFVTAVGLGLRRRHPDLFLEGTYEPLTTEGPRASHLVAFARRLETRVLIAVVPRLTAALGPDPHRLPIGHAAWGTTGLRLPRSLGGRAVRDLLTDTRIDVPQEQGRPILMAGDVLQRCPVALLWAERSEAIRGETLADAGDLDSAVPVAPRVA